MQEVPTVPTETRLESRIKQVFTTFDTDLFRYDLFNSGSIIQVRTTEPVDHGGLHSVEHLV